MAIPNDGAKTLWIGDIETWMDENYVASLFTGVSIAFLGLLICLDRICLTS